LKARKTGWFYGLSWGEDMENFYGSLRRRGTARLLFF